jgi:hypothetical protein
MLNTKVLSAEKKDGKVTLKTEAAKGGKEDTVSNFELYFMDIVSDILFFTARSRCRPCRRWP